MVDDGEAVAQNANAGDDASLKLISSAQGKWDVLISRRPAVCQPSSRTIRNNHMRHVQVHRRFWLIRRAIGVGVLLCFAALDLTHHLPADRAQIKQASTPESTRH
jgi:hypothetical protein